MIVSVLAFLGYSFGFSEAWLTLCYGLALFLFGMQCVELGLQQATGGTLERLMAKSTQSPIKGFVFGMSTTFILQSSTLVSLPTITFLSSGMIGLAGGSSIIFWYEPRCDERYLAACLRWAESKPQRLCPTDADVWRIDGPFG